jgi:hypothetical protein
MGFLRRLFGPEPEPVRMFEEAIERLQIGIAVNLAMEYGSRLRLGAPNEAILLANCVLSYATAMRPIGENAQNFEQSHSELVRRKAFELEELAELAETFSYLYAAITLLLAIQTHDPYSEQAKQEIARQNYHSTSPAHTTSAAAEIQ